MKQNGFTIFAVNILQLIIIFSKAKPSFFLGRKNPSSRHHTQAHPHASSNTENQGWGKSDVFLKAEKKNLAETERKRNEFWFSM